MTKKKLVAFVFTCILGNTNYAQNAASDSVVIANEDSCNIESIQSAVDACLLFVESVEAKDTAALVEVIDVMKACRLTDFASLRQKNRNENGSLDGHMVFNIAFADSLVQGKDPYKNADFINRSMTHRGQMKPGEILTKTCFVKANGKSVYTFNSRGRQELAIVAEPGGLVTTRIHVVNKEKKINEWHNDTFDVAKGRNSRKSAFTLPQKLVSLVTLEITNCTNKDISVVVISN